MHCELNLTAMKTSITKTLFTVVFSLCLAVSVVAGEARYVFYFIGDGMGPNQVLTTEMYLAELQGRISRSLLGMTQLPYAGQVSTFSHTNGITDSSAAGTCLATGAKTSNGVLGLDANGNRISTIAEVLKERGWGVGITTSVSIDHATPAAFYAHVPKRNMYYTIGTQLAESDFDFFGGATFYQPHDPDDPATPSLYNLLDDHHYTVARGYADYLVKREEAERMVLIQDFEGLTTDYRGTGMLPYAIDKKEGDLTLPQITTAAVDFLSSRYDRFFLMVEGGAIDWACHSNDAATVMGEVIEFDQAIGVALDFYRQHPEETLIVITADHETGGMALGNSDYTLNLQILQYQKTSVAKLSDRIKELYVEQGSKLRYETVQAVLTEQLGFYTDSVQITKDEDRKLRDAFAMLKKNKGGVKTLYKKLNKLSDTAIRILNRKSKVGWTTGAHSAAAVPIFAIGAGAEHFTGWIDNTQIVPYLFDSVVE